MVRERLVLKKEIKKLIRKALYTIIIFLLGMISVKQNPNLKQEIESTVYKESPKYMKARNIYKKYFGNYLNKNTEKAVFTDKLTYKKEEKYKSGVKLEVSDKYPVPVLESGIIIYMENNKVVISQVNGIEVEYSNIKVSNYKLYDYIEKSNFLGETLTNELYLTFKKEGKYLDYKKYI